MEKKYLIIILFCQGVGIHQLAYADIIDKNKLGYASPCEEIEPESNLLNKLNQQIRQASKIQQSKIVEHFWQDIAISQAPVVEKINEDVSRVIYLWRGAKYNARLVGGPSNEHEWLTRIPNTDIWFKEIITPNNFLGSYSFAIDIKNLTGYLSNYCPHLNKELKESREQRIALRDSLQIDPNNSQRFLKHEIEGLRNENIVKLSKAPQFVEPNKYPSRSLQVNVLNLRSKILNNERKVKIYKSARKNIKETYITAIFFDGKEYDTLLDVPKALDILVEQGKLPPIQAIFIYSVDEKSRPKELTPNKEFSKFFQEEFLPWLDQNIDRDTQKTVLIGSSLGGLSAAYLALENPKQISHVVPLSGSFWWMNNKSDEPNGMSYLIRNKKLTTRQHWYISANSYETSKAHNELSILNTSPIVANDLKRQGQNVIYKSYTGGHSYAIWQVVLQDALQFFFHKPL